MLNADASSNFDFSAILLCESRSSYLMAILGNQIINHWFTAFSSRHVMRKRVNYLVCQCVQGNLGWMGQNPFVHFGTYWSGGSQRTCCVRNLFTFLAVKTDAMFLNLWVFLYVELIDANL